MPIIGIRTSQSEEELRMPMQNSKLAALYVSEPTAKLAVPLSLLDVLQRLQGAGFRVVVVGGALRDFLRGEPVSDYDLASNVLAQQVQKLFRRSIPIGLQHGTVAVRQGAETYEITTFRSDGIYQDGRHPEKVEFTGDLIEDLQRRDFTINAIAFEPEPTAALWLEWQARSAVTGKTSDKKLDNKEMLVELPGQWHDLHGGREDLQQRRICAIGQPSQRFAEDALRMLRACRLSAKLGFSIEKHTLAAMGHLHGNLEKVSKPRIQEELRKLLCAPYAGLGLRYLADSGLWSQVFLPSLQPPGELWQRGQSLGYALSRSHLQDTENTYGILAGNLQSGVDSSLLAGFLQAGLQWQEVPLLSFCWALLYLQQLVPSSRGQVVACLDSVTAKGHMAEGKGSEAICTLARQGLEHLGFSNREKNAALVLLEQYPVLWGPEFLEYYVASKEAEQARLLRHWLALFQPHYTLPALCLLAISNREGDGSLWQEFFQGLQAAMAGCHPLQVSDLAIDGRVLAGVCGIPAGPVTGRILLYLLKTVLQHPEDNRAEILQQKAREWYLRNYE